MARDIRSYFGTTTPSTSAISLSNASGDDSHVESSAPRKARTTFPLSKEKSSKRRKYRKEWEKIGTEKKSEEYPFDYFANDYKL